MRARAQTMHLFTPKIPPTFLEFIYTNIPLETEPRSQIVTESFFNEHFYRARYSRISVNQGKKGKRAKVFARLQFRNTTREYLFQLSRTLNGRFTELTMFTLYAVYSDKNNEDRAITLISLKIIPCLQ